ncbi:MAG: ATP synthase F1 subunit delta [Acidobacteriota bacterium]|nr:ATP synthase F1 subunit delta [Acidobacteriota bacterium]
MSAEQVANRYAKALIEALAEKNAVDQADVFLEFCRMAAAHDELSRLFASVTVSAEDKVKVVTALGVKLGLPDMVRNFLRILAANGRMEIIGPVAEAVSQRLDAHRNIQAVRLTTAAELGPDDVAKFSEAMAAMLGSKIRVETTTDPAILGGAVAQVGSFVYDGSVRAQLDRLRGELIKEN